MHDKSNPCLAAALAYATNSELPLHVFSAKPGEKKSRLSKQYAADGKNWGMSNNPNTIRKNWNLFPDSNVCIVTGDVNGFFAVDTDTKEGHPDLAVEGEESLAKLIAANGGEWPKTLTAISPSGSRHYLLGYPEGNVVIRNSDSKIGIGIDIRGDGGMIIAPPSYDPKRDARYRWEDPEQRIATAPAWLIKLVAQKPPDRKPGEPQAPIAELAAGETR